MIWPFNLFSRPIVVKIEGPIHIIIQNAPEKPIEKPIEKHPETSFEPQQPINQEPVERVYKNTDNALPELHIVLPEVEFGQEVPWNTKE